MKSRFDQREKQRKINKFYNIAITFVTLSIIVVSIYIFTGNDAVEVSEPEKVDTDVKEEVDGNETNENSQGDAIEVDPEETANHSIVEVEKSDANVLKAYTNESWEPVGTAQTGEHVTSFQKDSIDWQEMSKAIAYGAGLDEANMRLWWLKNGGEHNKAIGTVTEGEDGQAYRVYIEWIDGQGWKPFKVEELKENDKGQ